jgi:predicted nucleotidyltransferase
MTSNGEQRPDPGGLRARVETRRSAVIATADRYGAHNVRLFGSLARGDHTDASDVDLLVDFDDGVGLFAVARLVAELEQLLESHVDVVSSGSLRPWDDDVLEEAIPL